MTDPTCACGNAARYVDDRGALTCALCPVKRGADSIRITEVPALLAHVRDLLRVVERHQLHLHQIYPDEAHEIIAFAVNELAVRLREVVGRAPQPGDRGRGSQNE